MIFMEMLQLDCYAVPEYPRRRIPYIMEQIKQHILRYDLPNGL